MLDNTITVTIGASSVDLTRVNQDNFSSTYFGTDGDDKVSMTVKHTIPSRGASGESHLVRMDIEHYDTEGVYLRTSSAWTVIKTFDGPQDSSDSSDVSLALVGFLTSANVAKVVARES